MPKIISMLSVIAAGFATTKLLDLVWSKATGHEPPRGEEDDFPLKEIVVYAAISGGLAALAKAGAARAAARWIAKPSVTD